MASSISNTDLNQKPDNSILLNSMDQSAIPSQAQILHQVSGKHQMLPVVYIQTPSKITTQKSNTNNVIINTLPQIQIQTKPANQTQQSLLIGNQPIVLQKPPNMQTIPVTPKNGVTYLTMLKPATKPADTNLITSNRLPISTINKLNISSSNTTPNSSQKIVIAPMPKVTSNRLPVTATTNSVQPKISFMPLSLPKKPHKVLNFKISEGQIQPDNGTIKVMCEANEEKGETEPSLFCNEIIDDETEKKKDEKTYQISIIEDSNSVNDAGFTISINEDEKKDAPKYSKHGVSILKKTYNLDKRETNSVKSSIKSITTISDTNTKEVKITSECNEEAPAPPRKSGRRKSTICLRKDYDEDLKEVVCKKPKLEIKQEMEEVKEVKVKEEFVEQDVKKLLSWEGEIGTLPGSNLKFHMNEFGFLEYLTNEDYLKLTCKKNPKVKESKKEDLQEEMRCLECGCYGMPSEFISPKYCSFDCQTNGEKNAALKLKKKKKKGWIKRGEPGEVKQESTDDDNTSNENSSDKYNYPWNCNKKGFSWAKYLDHIKAISAPVKLFKDPFPYNRNGFRPGMKLEGIDPEHPSYFCVLSVAEAVGYRIRLHFDGYPDNYDFWVNADSRDIFPVGFCEKYGRTLHPPPTYSKDFNWNFYLKYTRSPAAPRFLFMNRPGNAIFPNGFRTGMKLEAVDRKNTALVCVATITDLMDNRILVHFDSWDDMYDYWADPTSPYIHPVGWCDQNGHSLTPPNDYPNPETFTWEKYLKETKSAAAPVRAFKQRAACGFKKGMRFECVDRRVPQLVRVATVDEVKDHQLRIKFDGWPDRYNYWVDDDSTDIHPVGWCQKTGHPLEPPLTPDDVYDYLECATVGCRGQGHIQGPIYRTHSSQKYCPYAEENIDLEKILPARLLTPDRQIEAVVPISREPKVSKGKTKYKPIEIKTEWEEPDEQLEEMSIDKEEECLKRIETPDLKKEEVFEEVNEEEVKMREKHSKYLTNHLESFSDPRDWSYEEVVNFVNTIPRCKVHSSLFSKNKIDGVSLLMLTQQDLVEILNFKLGPAITLYNCILILRRTVINCT